MKNSSVRHSPVKKIRPKADFPECEEDLATDRHRALTLFVQREVERAISPLLAARGVRTRSTHVPGEGSSAGYSSIGLLARARLHFTGKPIRKPIRDRAQWI
jgi:hypothetical protein